MSTYEINTRLPDEFGKHITSVVGSRYKTISEYIRYLIRCDMKKKDATQVNKSIIEGYKVGPTKTYFKSTGNFKDDMRIFHEKEAEYMK
ncbi:MAG: hypothetical protein HQM13_07450 [SAR324 cluster bacterium]|nr:hypothetical protein [SAR324 cluster bacterium]